MYLLFWFEYVICFIAVTVDIVDVFIPFVTYILPMSVIDTVVEYLWNDILEIKALALLTENSQTRDLTNVSTG
jgi:hypothetical protein